MKKMVCHPVVGEITLSRTQRATRLSLSVRPDGSVRLAYPIFVSHKRALAFLETKIGWIAETRAKLSQKYLREPITEYSTRRHTLRIEAAALEKITVRIKDGEIVVRHPAAVSPESEEVQEVVEKGIVEALRVEAKELLPAMTTRLAALHGFRHGKVSVKASRSKWGSCTARNDINLSLFLVLLPDRLAEYVVLHELCHTVHKDHSPRFHALLDSVADGRSKELNRELRAYRPDIRAMRDPKFKI